MTGFRQTPVHGCLQTDLLNKRLQLVERAAGPDATPASLTDGKIWNGGNWNNRAQEVDGKGKLSVRLTQIEKQFNSAAYDAWRVCAESREMWREKKKVFL